jgi:hypothetical protein
VLAMAQCIEPIEFASERMTHDHPEDSEEGPFGANELILASEMSRVDSPYDKLLEGL